MLVVNMIIISVISVYFIIWSALHSFYCCFSDRNNNKSPGSYREVFKEIREEKNPAKLIFSCSQQ